MNTCEEKNYLNVPNIEDIINWIENLDFEKFCIHDWFSAFAIKSIKHYDTEAIFGSKEITITNNYNISDYYTKNDIQQLYDLVKLKYREQIQYQIDKFTKLITNA